MGQSICLVPGQARVGMVTVALGLQHALQTRGLRVAVLHVVHDGDDQARLEVLLPGVGTAISGQVGAAGIQRLISERGLDEFLARVIKAHAELQPTVDVVIVRGAPHHVGLEQADYFNQQLARALSSKVLLVSLLPKHLSDTAAQIAMQSRWFGGLKHARMLGVIFNKVGVPYGCNSPQKIDLLEAHAHEDLYEERVNSFKKTAFYKDNKASILGMIAWRRQFYAPRSYDIGEFLGAVLLRQGDMMQKRVHRVKLCARTANNVLHVLQPNTLLVTAGDRADILLAASLAALKGINLSGIIMTGKYQLSENVVAFCEEAFVAGLPLMTVAEDSYATVSRLKDFKFNIPSDDQARIELVCQEVMHSISVSEIVSGLESKATMGLSPAAFQYQILAQAKENLQRIVLPEGDEIRTLEAASHCAAQGIAHLVLLGDRNKINKAAQDYGLVLTDNMEIIDPVDISEKYVDSLVQLRQHKGVTEVVAREYLLNPVMLGTMMLQQGAVDGLVSGAVHTTADTMRPALQIIKTAPGFNLVSSVFFMCLPEQVLVFGDCAINPEPNAEQLAEIALQSADTAAALGIEPRVAMLSYSTGGSGHGAEVEKVKQATALVKQQRPDLQVDGPLQYDAALIDSVAQKKAPGSQVAGRATVLIFPDLNTGNTTYKAVQRSADIISIGPIMQGLNKPVNDLSRGAQVKDIIYTIAMTALQANQRTKK